VHDRRISASAEESTVPQIQASACRGPQSALVEPPDADRKTASKARSQSADVVKGIAILLVVLGHAIQAGDAAFDRNLLFRLIYSFHMQLFMAVSGWFARPDDSGRLKRDAVRLLVPTVTWYCVQYFVAGRYAQMGAGAYIMRWVRNPDTGLWFLWILLLCHVVLCGARFFERIAGLSSYLLFVMLLWFVPSLYFGTKLLRFNFIYFAAGYLVARHKDLLRPLFAPAGIVAAIAWPFAMHGWQRIAPTGTGVGVTVFSRAVSVSSMRFAAAHFIAPFLGIILLCWICSVVNWVWLASTASWFGRRTLEIYVSHQFFMQIRIGTGNWSIAASFFIALAGALALAEGLRRSPLTNLIFYGKPASPRAA